MIATLGSSASVRADTRTSAGGVWLLLHGGIVRFGLRRDDGRAGQRRRRRGFCRALWWQLFCGYLVVERSDLAAAICERSERASPAGGGERAWHACPFRRSRFSATSARRHVAVAWWRLVAADHDAAGPTPRLGAVAAGLGDKVVLFGGETPRARRSVTRGSGTGRVGHSTASQAAPRPVAKRAWCSRARRRSSSAAATATRGSGTARSGRRLRRLARACGTAPRARPAAATWCCSVARLVQRSSTTRGSGTVRPGRWRAPLPPHARVTVRRRRRSARACCSSVARTVPSISATRGRGTAGPGRAFR